jgi:GNAT superfamily N-acetyltransferase
MSAAAERIMEFHRVLNLNTGVAEHNWLKVEPEHRGKGFSAALLLRSFDFYRALGLRRVELDAGIQTGKWHWARVGFEFDSPRTARRSRTGRSRRRSTTGPA